MNLLGLGWLQKTVGYEGVFEKVLYSYCFSYCNIYLTRTTQNVFEFLMINNYKKKIVLNVHLKKVGKALNIFN